MSRIHKDGRLMRSVEVLMFIVPESIRHKEQVFVVVWMTGKFDEGGRVRESRERVESVTKSPLLRASFEVENV